MFSASVRYGRSSSNKDVHQQTNPKPIRGITVSPVSGSSPYPLALDNLPTRRCRTARNTSFVDFQAGKDVGLGMFGTARIVRAQLWAFASRNSAASPTSRSIRSRLALHNQISDIQRASQLLHQRIYTPTRQPLRAAQFPRHRPFTVVERVRAVLQATRKMENSLSIGALNAAFLFRRQRAQVHHQTTGDTVTSNSAQLCRRRIMSPIRRRRSNKIARAPSRCPMSAALPGYRSVIRMPKSASGYRADMFFGAMDGGIDTRKTRMSASTVRLPPSASGSAVAESGSSDVHVTARRKSRALVVPCTRRPH